MKSMHNVLNDVTQFEVGQEELVTLSGDRQSLKVPARWALAATPEDVADLLQGLARCAPAVGDWDHDVLVHAMNALKRA